MIRWCLLALLISLPAAADTISPEKADAIRELMSITGAQADRDELVRTFSQQLISVLEAAQMALDDQARALIREEVAVVIDQQLADETLQSKMYQIYARYFTLEELKGLIAFNRSAVGAKANRVMPLLMRESMAAAQQWSEEVGPQMSQRVQQRLQTEGYRISR